MREGVFIISPLLTACWPRKICEEELRGSNMSVQARRGRRLGQELGITVPGGSSKEHCRREKCFTCNTGREGVCRRTGAGYNITCTICENTIKSEYAGETGKNKYVSGLDYVKDVEKKKTNKPLWKHIVKKHEGVVQVTMFSHFTMKLVQFFSKPQRRKANVGVRIVHLNPETRISSKYEFLEGTNIFMQPIRGVGV